MINFFQKIGKFFLFEIAPEIIVILHFSWIVIIIASTVYVFFNSAHALFHIYLITAGLVVGLIFGYCPLTKIEENLRSRKGKKISMDNSFLTFYLNKIGVDVSKKRVLFLTVIFYVISYLVAGFALIFG